MELVGLNSDNPMIQIDQLISIQADLIDQIRKIEINLHKEGNRKTVISLNNRLFKLETKFKEFKENHRNIVILCGANKNAEYFTKDIFNSTEEIVMNISEQIQGEINNLLPPVNQNVLRPQADQDPMLLINDVLRRLLEVNGQRNMEINLPKINIPSFSGNYHKWTTFYDLYTTMIHNKETLSAVQKFHYLKTHLADEAKQMIDHVQITEANYATAWQMLVDRYQNVRLLVNSHVHNLMSQPTLTTASSTQIKNLLDITKENLNCLQNLNIDIQTWNPIIIYIITQRLDPETRRLWEQSLQHPKEIPTLELMTSFLETRFQSLEMIQTISPNFPENTFSDYSKVEANSNFFSKKQQSIKQKSTCFFCSSSEHKTFKCTKFNEMSEHSRLKWAQQTQRCVNCLQMGHNVYSCPSKNTCSICKKNHHTLLHLPKQNSAFNYNKQPSTNSNISCNRQYNSNKIKEINKSQSDLLNAQQSKVVLLATALVKCPDIYGVYHTFRALIDQGSESSFITEHVAQTLRIPKNKSSTTIYGIGNNPYNCSSSIQFKIQSIHSNYQLNVKALVLPFITKPVPSNKLNINWEHLQGLKLADPCFNQPSQVNILIGSDYYGHLILNGLRKGRHQTPIAQETTLGWIISGKTDQENNDNNMQRSYHIKIEENVDCLLQKFWEIEEIPSTNNFTEEEMLCEKIYEKTHQRNQDGSYTVSLPFRIDNTGTLGDSRKKAMARFIAMEKTFVKNPQLHKQYVDFINEYVSLDHSELAQTLEINNTSNHFYLPHHAVMREASTTTKLRVVFDASSKTSSGVSLNDKLLTGPNLQGNLYAIILRWRRNQYAITADIEKMYRQIKINPNQFNFQRILWRNNQSEPIKEYILKTVTYGTSSAPYLAIKTLKTLAKDDQHLYPKAAKALKSDFYMDDLMSGGETLEEIVQLKNDLSNLLKRGGFNLRKWNSNSKSLLKSIPENDRALSISYEINYEESIKTLGVLWNPVSDKFHFKINLTNHTNKPTKRMILSLSAKLFDPIGWLAPSIIIFKIMLQKLWIAGVGWDEVIPNHLQIEWNKLITDLPNLEEIQIPRWITYLNRNTTLELHGFCDSSNEAYAAVIYARVKNEFNVVSITLITAKTRVAPVKTISTPRLELCGATLLSNLAVKTKEAMEWNNIPITLWTDSTIVLSWLRNHPNKYKSFVANRISEIQQNHNSKIWRYVPTSENPADCATRGVRPSVLKDHPLWWNGPHWLKKEECAWPQAPKVNLGENLEENNKFITVLLSVKNNNFMEIIEKSSSFTNLCRLIAYCLRFINNSRSKTKLTGLLSVKEIKESRTQLLKSVQEVEFEEELKALRSNKSIPKTSKLLTLNPFLDERGVLRVGGRLENSNLAYGQKHQVILPSKNHFTLLLIDKIHKETLHGGTQLTLSKIREDFWIVNGRNTVRFQLFKCVTCFRFKTTAKNQLMGNLPVSRVNVSRPFLNVGIDYAGPIKIRVSKGRGNKTYKGYICVFVCLSTKAMHLEAVGDLTSEAFLAAFRRFISRRGRCENVYSDNGTNFVGADRLLKEERIKYIKHFRNKTAEIFANEAISWHFIPPSSPNFGGLWEAGVKSIKWHLKTAFGDTSLTFEEFSTVLSQIEACLNSRPLQAITEDPDDFEALTPGHFLIGAPLLAAPQAEIKNISNIKRWELTKRISQHFWNLWHKDYINSLQQRPKRYSKEVAQPKINDIVLVKEDNMPPTRWCMGRIEDIFPGADRITRVVSVKTNKGSFRRPAHKICVLPIIDNSNI